MTNHNIYPQTMPPQPLSLHIHTHNGLPSSSSAPPTLPTFPSFSLPPYTPILQHNSAPEDDVLDVIPTRAGRKLCVRHKQMANQNVNAKLQKSLDNLPTAERSAVTHLWSTFSSAPHVKRKLILEGILTMCCFSQLSHISDSLNQIIRIDPFSLLPREASLRTLGYLDAISLGRAAQVSTSWKALADDDLLWRRMCGQHIDRKCEKCGWGLPLLERRRLKVELKDGSPAVAVGVGAHEHGGVGKGKGKGKGREVHGRDVVKRSEVLGIKVEEGEGGYGNRLCDVPVFNYAGSGSGPGSGGGFGVKRSAPSSPRQGEGKRSRLEDSGSEAVVGEGDGEIKKAEEGNKEEVIKGEIAEEEVRSKVRLTRPWKDVYCERLVVERNWRKGRCTTKTLKGHTDGVMCLQYHTSLTSPSYPVLITGSYDRTIRIWNLDTATLVRQLTGHTRAVRCLQFDQMLLFTGAMDGTVRMWNWRAGECLRVLEGHTDGVVCLDYNGYLLATGSADSTVAVWNFRTGKRSVLRGHEEWVNSTRLWDGKSSPGDMDPMRLPSFTSRGGGGIGGSVENMVGEDGEKEKDRKGPDVDVGQMLFSASDDGTIRLWDLDTESCVMTFGGHKAQVQSLRVLMVDMSEEEVLRMNRKNKGVRRSVTPPGMGAGGFVSGNQMGLLGGGERDGLELDVPEGMDLEGIRRGEVGEPRVYLSPRVGVDEVVELEGGEGERKKKALLITGSLDGTVKIWNVEDGKEVATLFGHIEGVWAVDVDALRMASASHDRTIKVWDRESGTCVQTLVGHRGAVTSLQLSDDMIVSGSDDGDVMVWSFAPAASKLQ